MVAKKEIAPELLAEARRLYEQTLAPVGDIADMIGLSRSALYERVREGGWRSRRAGPTFSVTRAVSDGMRAPRAATAARAHDEAVAETAEPVTPQERMAIARRIMNTVEREMDAIERILVTITPADQLEAEHGARTLASLSRTLREIAALNKPDDETPQDDADADDEFPQDIDEFREELARRINELVDARRQRGSAGDIGGGTDAETA